MNNWKKITLGIIGLSILVFLMVWGLSRMSKSTAALVDEKVLLEGAVLSAESGKVSVTVVDFSDMQCPACKRAHDLTKQLRNIPGVKFVYRHFPLPIHANSRLAAQAVEAAREMGKGWEMLDILFDKQEEWSGDASVTPRLVGYAKTLGLDETEFSGKLSTAAEVVSKDEALAGSLQLSGTPTFFVNGEQVAVDFVMGKVQDLLKTK